MNYLKLMEGWRSFLNEEDKYEISDEEMKKALLGRTSKSKKGYVPGDDDEPEEEALDKKTTRILNSMLDTILRGSGLTGAVVSTLKNAIMRYQKEEEKTEGRGLIVSNQKCPFCHLEK